MAQSSATLRRHIAQSAIVVALATGSLSVFLGGAGLLFGGLISMVWLAWRFDNSAGTLLVVAIQIVIVCAILLVLLALMALIH